MDLEDIFGDIEYNIFSNQLENIKNILLENPDFDINYHPECGDPLIFIALDSFKYNILEYFLDYPGLDIHNKNQRGQNIFHRSINLIHNRYDLLQKMINLGIDVNQKTKDNLYPIFEVIIFNDNSDTVKFLLDNNANTDIKIGRDNISLLDYLRRYKYNTKTLDLIESYMIDIKEPGYE